MSSHRAPLVALALLVLGTACPTGSPPSAGPSASASASPSGQASPTPAAHGLQIGLVLAAPTDPASLENASVEAAAAAVATLPGLDVADVRVLEPDNEAFRADQVGLLAGDGADLVCTVGQDGADAIAAAADEFPGTRFCLLDGEMPRPPANVLTFPWRTEEGGYLLGAAAAWTGGAARVGFVSGLRGPMVERIRRGYEAGASDARPSIKVAVGFAIPGGDRVVDEADAAQAAALQYAGRSPVRVALVFGDAPTVRGVIAEAAAADGAVVGWGTDPAEVVDDADDTVLLTVARRFDVALVEAARRTLERAPSGQVTVGWSDDAFEIVPGESPLYEVIEDRVERLASELAAGQVDVPEG